MSHFGAFLVHFFEPKTRKTPSECTQKGFLAKITAERTILTAVKRKRALRPFFIHLLHNLKLVYTRDECDTGFF